MRVKLDEGCFRRIPTTRDDDASFTTSIMDIVMTTTIGDRLTHRGNRKARQRTPGMDRFREARRGGPWPKFAVLRKDRKGIK